jgi:NAD(P)H dehydrogenase (quinone)
MAKIIVTGVDGNFGGFVARNITKLTAKENLIFTCPFEDGLESFRKEGFDTRVANFNHKEGLQDAFSGGDVLLLISSPFVGEKRQQAHRNAIDAALAAGVKKIVYTSLVNARDPENPSIEKKDHAFTEEYVISTGADYIFLRNSQYAEAMITSYLTAQNDTMVSCQGDGHMSYISRKDCAKAAMYALTKDAVHKTVLNINGAESLTLKQFVDYGNTATGKHVAVKDVSEDEVYASFDAMGVPRTTDGKFKDGSPAPFSSDGMVTFARAIRLEKMNSHTNDFEKLTGSTPYTVSYMFEHADDFQIGKRNSTDK